MSDDEGEVNKSGVFMPKFLCEPRTLSSKKEREFKNTRFVPSAPRPHLPRSAPSKIRLIHSRSTYDKNESSLDSSFQILMNRGAIPQNTHSLFRKFFTVHERLGYGSFGEVYKCRNVIDGREWAVKKSKRVYTGEGDRTRQLREVMRVKSIPPIPNIVKLEQAWEEEGHLFLQMELCSKSLNQLIEDGHQLAESEVWDVLIDMLRALSHLHAHGLVHLDVKPDNIFLACGEPPLYKLGDFGIVVNLNENRDVSEFTEGDSRYLAPEVMQGVVSIKADVFSLGMTILEIGSHVDLPKSGELWHMLRSGSTLPEPSNTLLPKSLRSLLLNHMLVPCHSTRSSVDEILNLSLVRRRIATRSLRHSTQFLLGKIRALWLLLLSLLQSLLNSLHSLAPSSPSSPPSLCTKYGTKPCANGPTCCGQMAHGAGGGRKECASGLLCCGKSGNETGFGTSCRGGMDNGCDGTAGDENMGEDERVTPENSVLLEARPEIMINDQSFSDDDDFINVSKRTTPIFASTPISASKPRPSSRLRLTRSSRIGQTPGSPTSRNLLKEFEAACEI